MGENVSRRQFILAKEECISSPNSNDSIETLRQSPTWHGVKFKKLETTSTSISGGCYTNRDLFPDGVLCTR